MAATGLRCLIPVSVLTSAKWDAPGDLEGEKSSTFLLMEASPRPTGLSLSYILSAKCLLQSVELAAVPSCGMPCCGIPCCCIPCCCISRAQRLSVRNDAGDMLTPTLTGVDEDEEAEAAVHVGVLGDCGSVPASSIEIFIVSSHGSDLATGSSNAVLTPRPGGSSKSRARLSASLPCARQYGYRMMTVQMPRAGCCERSTWKMMDNMNHCKPLKKLWVLSASAPAR